MKRDVVIIGAGPAGLALAGSLSGSGLSVTVVESQSENKLALPAFDGREIALTHRSASLMKELGAWDHIPAEDLAPLRAARVWNGGAPFALTFDPGQRHEGGLGYMVSNHLIRRSLYQALREREDIELLCDSAATSVSTEDGAAWVKLADGTEIEARLVVAADTRFSETRRRQGIGAGMVDFGKTMLVCRVAHEKPHDYTATEWFEHGHTIAMLPMNGNRSSAVLTVTGETARKLLAMPEDAFSAEVTKRFRGRLGEMTLEGTRHAYPLVAVYARRFIADRFALVGDAAVGMHPVTAHGFNFGLIGQRLLASGIRAAAAKGGDIGSADVLRPYERSLRRATFPLWMGTNTLARFYLDETPPALLARNAAILAAQHVPFFRRLAVGRLLREDVPALA